jgi:nitrogen fixation/metabolism regulation signal transduction histidine kinase
MLLISAVSSIAALIFILYLPNYLVRPVNELIKKITEISRGNYNQQLNIHSNDELGKLSSAFNNMAVKLKEYEKNNINKYDNLDISTEEKCILSFLKGAGCEKDEIAAATGLQPGKVMAALTMLEIKGLIQQIGGIYLLI